MKLPALHAGMLERIKAALPGDARIAALLGGGSMVQGGFDEQSDLDLIVVVHADAHVALLADARAFAAQFGSLLSAFTGQHVGEPRLLICLYGPPLLHVDLKFITPADLDELYERPLVLWARDDEAIRRRIANTRISPPQTRDAQWYEERMWLWLHYGATKLLRGELMEAASTLDFIRLMVLGPMLQRNAGVRQRNVRRIEEIPGAREKLVPTMPTCDPVATAEAYRFTCALYVELRQSEPPPSPVAGMPGLMIDFIDR
ncbi:MAG: nucleotidyltransferase domain-containing protein [Alphaproteobacteria bacterium]|nr:nucleotidyltransferase domain-containing protein [Alphaproteobacteria bacterium]MCW5744263.1 nucleotidyltransferase domain-containing protein [Alphaproteobacteria bacterium]